MRVFDFDNTIYDGESPFDMFFYYLKKDFKGVFKFVPKFIQGFIKNKYNIEYFELEYGPSLLVSYFEGNEVLADEMQLQQLNNIFRVFIFIIQI